MLFVNSWWRMTDVFHWKTGICDTCRIWQVPSGHVNQCSSSVKKEWISFSSSAFHKCLVSVSYIMVNASTFVWTNNSIQLSYWLPLVIDSWPSHLNVESPSSTLLLFFSVKTSLIPMRRSKHPIAFWSWHRPLIASFTSINRQIILSSWK